MIFGALALATFVVGAVVCLLVGKRSALAAAVGSTSVAVGCAVASVPVIRCLAGNAIAPLDLPWQLPCGALRMGLDMLSAVFALPILVIAPLAAFYGVAYLHAPGRGRAIAIHWSLFNLFVAGMLLVVFARNGLLFLLAWEVMSLASFGLVMFEADKPQVRHAGWTYLVATHIGTAALLVMFALLGRGAGTLTCLDTMVVGSPVGVIFVLAVVGFGTKAGIMPMHVWLPEAHPAAPSHVSAVMSGVMIKVGIHGLLRVLTVLGTPAAWWGWTLIALGAVSACVGILYAIAQSDLKRLLAYSSIENVGLITLALGIALLGGTAGNVLVAELAFAGALLHVLNHALFKSLLFLGAGVVQHATGTRELDCLGGLLKRLPAVGAAFLVGSIAICGIPPLNGFAGEFLVYLAALRAFGPMAALPPGGPAAAVTVVLTLALAGGLAVACFAKVFGIAFLGEPRQTNAALGHAPTRAMMNVMLVLAALCLIAGFAAPLVLRAVAGAVAVLGGTAASTASPVLAEATGTLWRVVAMSGGLVALASVLFVVRARLLAGRAVTAAVTWDCGYAAPAVSMQYTASSFADPIVHVFRRMLGTRRHLHPPQGLFPTVSSFASETPDAWRTRFYDPLFAAVERLLERLCYLQHGRLNLYILYIVLALLALIAWKMR